MRKVSQKELERMQARGEVTTKRKMGAGKPTERKAEKPRKPPVTDVAMASMAATQKYLAEQSTALTDTISSNSKKIEDFRESLQSIAKEAGKRVPYEFEIKRGKNKLIEKIVATPMKGE